MIATHYLLHIYYTRIIIWTEIIFKNTITNLQLKL